VQEFPKKEKIVKLPHPPYSPDLSPCDFFLFPKLKKSQVDVITPEMQWEVQYISVWGVYQGRTTLRHFRVG